MVENASLRSRDGEIGVEGEMRERGIGIWDDWVGVGPTAALISPKS